MKLRFKKIKYCINANWILELLTLWFWPLSGRCGVFPERWWARARSGAAGPGAARSPESLPARPGSCGSCHSSDTECHPLPSTAVEKEINTQCRTDWRGVYHQIKAPDS